MTISRGRAKKNPAKEVAKPLSEEVEIKKSNDKEQNTAIPEDNPKTKSVRNTKKGNAKKTTSKGKLNTVADKVDETQEEETATPEVDVKENGETHMAEHKQKKKNAGKANAAMNGKVEAKGKQKKGQAAAATVDEKEAIKEVIAETEINTEIKSDVDENDTKDISLSKDDSVLQNEEEENKFNECKADSTKDDSNAEISIKETERSGTFLCF